MSSPQTKVEPIDWTDLPDDHRLGFGWKKRKENLEDVSQDLKSANIEGFEKGDLDWEQKLDSILGMNSEEYENREEAIDAIQDELEEERNAIDQTKEFFDEAAELAEQHVKDVRKELGVEEARERGWFSAEEAIQIDGFHYVHSQTWFPILEKTDETEFKDDLQSISERALEVDHAADAYQVDREIYEEITSDLKKPLQNFIAIGKLGEDNEYRQRIEQELMDSLTDWITSEEAEEYLEKLDSHLDWRTTERYVNLEELDQETIETLKENLNIEHKYEDTDEEAIIRYRLAQELASGRIKERTVKEQFSDTLVEKLGEMQENLQSKSRGRLINSIEDPENSEILDTLNSAYKTKKWLWLSSYWGKEGDPMSKDISSVHADISRVSNNIRKGFSRGEHMVPKDLLKSLDDLGANLPKIRYWQVNQNRIFLPDLPLDSYQQGMICSTINQGKTSAIVSDEGKNPGLKYSFSERENSKVRFKAIENLFSGERGIGKYSLNINKRSRTGDPDFLDEDYSEANLNEQFWTKLPACLGFLRGITEENPDSLDDYEFAEGYVTQALWDRGFSSSKGGIQFRPKDHENFKHALETLEIDYYEQNISYNDGKKIRIPNSEIGEYGFLEEFQEAYLQSKN